MTQTEQKARLFACACVRQVQDLLIDDRSRNAVEVAERFAKGQASEDDLRRSYREATTAAGDIAQHSRGSGRFFAAEAARWTAEENATQAEEEATKSAARAIASEATAELTVSRMEAFEAEERRALERLAKIKAEIYASV